MTYTECRPFLDPIRKKIRIHPVSTSLKWPILTCSPLVDRQHTSPSFQLKITKPQLSLFSKLLFSRMSTSNQFKIQFLTVMFSKNSNSSSQIFHISEIGITIFNKKKGTYFQLLYIETTSHPTNATRRNYFSTCLHFLYKS